MVLQFYILSLGKILCMKFQQKQLHIRHKNCPSVMICFNFIYSIILWTVTLILHFVEKKRPTAVLSLLASIKLLAPSTVQQHINSLDLLSFIKFAKTIHFFTTGMARNREMSFLCISTGLACLQCLRKCFNI